MGFESFDDPERESKQGLARKQEQQKTFIEIKKKIGNFDISVGIERGQEPIRGNIDLTKKNIGIRVTPEGIRRGIDAVGNFLNSPEADEMFRAATLKIRSWRAELAKKRALEDRKTIRRYARQTGKTEAEVITEILDEIDRKFAPKE